MPTIDLHALQQQVWQTAETKGHHVNLALIDPRLQMLVRLALVHTEISEAQEIVYNTISLDEPRLIEECADIAIRLLEMCWCAEIPLMITPECFDKYLNAAILFRQYGLLHMLIDRITQSVKRYGITPAMRVLTQNALECCWDIACALGSDLEQAIRMKDAHNQTRPYQYWTPGAHA